MVRDTQVDVLTNTFPLIFDTDSSSDAQFNIVNALGSRVTLITKPVKMGNNQFGFDASVLPVGTYFSLLQMDNKIAVEKFVKIRQKILYFTTTVVSL